MQVYSDRLHTDLDRTLVLSNTLRQLSDLRQGMVLGYAIGLSDQKGLSDNETDAARGEKR